MACQFWEIAGNTIAGMKTSINASRLDEVQRIFTYTSYLPHQATYQSMADLLLVRFGFSSFVTLMLSTGLRAWLNPYQYNKRSAKGVFSCWSFKL